MSFEKWVADMIIDFVCMSELNRFSSDNEERIWDKPLVGFSKGDDPYYNFFKNDIGDFYLTPEEFFNNAINDRISMVMLLTGQNDMRHLYLDLEPLAYAMG